MKYHYIVYWQINDAGNALTSDGWKEYLAKQDEVTKKHGFKLVMRGVPYGVIESIVEVYESEKTLDALRVAYSEAGRGKIVSAANTITVLPLFM
ncbi:hypothetical protein FJY84_05830 [Candidatus Bathyarchaeota archaeon]|nr:hypothetical protein [Candidatus Bathyarchaeota archaeon]